MTLMPAESLQAECRNELSKFRVGAEMTSRFLTRSRLSTVDLSRTALRRRYSARHRHACVSRDGHLLTELYRPSVRARSRATSIHDESAGHAFPPT